MPLVGVGALLLAMKPEIRCHVFPKGSLPVHVERFQKTESSCQPTTSVKTPKKTQRTDLNHWSGIIHSSSTTGLRSCWKMTASLYAHSPTPAFTISRTHTLNYHATGWGRWGIPRRLHYWKYWTESSRRPTTSKSLCLSLIHI